MNIHFKSIILTALLASATCAFTACDDDKDMPAAFTISDSAVSIAYDGLNKDGDRALIELTATDNWSMTQADEWLTLSQTSGTHGSYSLYIMAEENNTGKDRRGFIEINMGGHPEMITVNQARKTIELTLNPQSIEANAIGMTEENETPEITVSANENWTLSLPSNCDWITPNVTEGTNGKTNVTFSLKPNTTGADRSATVEFTALELTRKLTVKQGWLAFATDLAGDPTNLTFGANGDEAKLTFNFTSLDAWKIADKPEWITVSPANGNAGTTEVTITAADNDGLARTGKVTISTQLGFGMLIDVAQRRAPMPFDSKNVGFIYFQDDMSWATGGQDQVGSNGGSAGTTVSIHGNAALKAELEKRYIDLNAAGKSVYAAAGYMKCGKSANQNAFMLKNPLDIEANHQANIEITFRAAKNKTDGVKLAVGIEGDGEIVNASNDAKTLSEIFEPINNPDSDKPWQWKEFKVTVKGVTADTKIVIGESQYIINGFKTRSGYYRYFIDDITVKRIAND